MEIRNWSDGGTGEMSDHIFNTTGSEELFAPSIWICYFTKLYLINTELGDLSSSLFFTMLILYSVMGAWSLSQWTTAEPRPLQKKSWAKKQA